MKINFHLPLPGQPQLSEVRAWRAPVLTEQANQAIYVQIDEWIDRYGTNIFVVNEITGRMYAEIGGKLHSIPEIASHRHQEEPALMPGMISKTRPVLGNEHWGRNPFRKSLLHGNAREPSQHKLLG